MGGQIESGQVAVFADRKPGDAPIEELAFPAYKKRPAMHFWHMDHPHD
jgi:hypothetical protein